MAASNRVGGLLGAEMEMAVADSHSGRSSHVHRYFASLAQRKYQQGCRVAPVWLAGRCIGIQTPLAQCGLDNGLNLLETALAPVPVSEGGLSELARRLDQELDDTLHALSEDGQTVLNVAQHPVCERDAAWYRRTRLPRPIY